MKLSYLKSAILQAPSSGNGEDACCASDISMDFPYYTPDLHTEYPTVRRRLAGGVLFLPSDRRALKSVISTISRQERLMEVKLSGLEEGAEAKVSFWYFDEGEHVDEGEDLAEMATDKAVFNVPAPVSGTLAKILVKEGETAGNDDVVAIIEEG
jgi:acetyl/propionyl-CoA carboxylase alpha subunit